MKQVRESVGREPGEECPRYKVPLEQRPWGRCIPGTVQEEQTVRLEGGGRVAGDEDRDITRDLSDQVTWVGAVGDFDQRREQAPTCIFKGRFWVAY